jgi:succinyldiaminopimelate transaminase
VARAHPEGIVDLSVGAPVDPTPAVVERALAAASQAPGYPLTRGAPSVREAAAAYLSSRWGAGVDAENVLPVIGTKELVAWLPTLVGLGDGDSVAFPSLAYPTYEVGALLAGATPVRASSLTSLGPRRVGLLWLNSPANPDGRVLPVDHLAKVVAWARERGTVVASDECYLEFGWDAEPVSILHPDVCGGSHAGLLAVHSLSKRSNMAGYRAGVVAGDPALVAELHEVRRHAGMVVPAPVQAAMVAAFDDRAHVVEQRRLYRARRDMLMLALAEAGFAIEHSEGSLYLWATRDEPALDSVGWLAQRGVLVAPGDFYGPAGARHIRVSLTATDERVEAGCARITA